MKRRHNPFHGSSLSFIDLLFNIIILFVLLFFVALMMMNPDSKKKDIESKADLMIVLTWPDNNPHDIDLWLKTPDSLIGYPNRENSYAHLEQDNLGMTNNFIMRDNERVEIPTRREVITFRGTPNGRFVVNVHFFTANGPEAGNAPSVPVTVELIQINPTYKILAKKDIVLERVKQQKTAFAFVIRENEVTDIDDDLDDPFLTNYSSSVDQGH